MKKGKLKKKLNRALTLLNQLLEKMGDRIIDEDKLESYTCFKIEKPKNKNSK